MASRNGGIEKTRDFARIFFVPGMWHGNMANCNPLSYVRNWVERSVPGALISESDYKANLYQQKVAVKVLDAFSLALLEMGNHLVPRPEKPQGKMLK